MKIFKQTVFIFLIAFILTGCANQVKESDRIEQDYKFSSALYIGYKKDDGSGENAVTGEIKFSKKSILITVNDGTQTTTDDCSIRTVTYDKDPNEIKYRTNKGDIVVKITNDTIKEVTLYTGEFLTIFNKAKDIELTNLQIPSPIDNPEDGWKRIEIKEVGTIDLPPTMEIQAGKYKEFNQKAREVIKDKWKIEFDEAKLTIQPKGINEFDQTALKKYARVMVEIIPGNSGEFSKLTQKLNFTQKELDELSQEFKSQIIQGFSGTTLNLIEWYPTESVEINNMPAIKISYKRQFKQEPYVIVNIYRFQNHDRIHSLTISYRETEKKYWTKTMDKVLKSFRITNIK